MALLCRHRDTQNQKRESSVSLKRLMHKMHEQIVKLLLSMKTCHTLYLTTPAVNKQPLPPYKTTKISVWVWTDFVWSITLTSWKMIYCLAPILDYIVCTKQQACGVSTQRMLLGIFSRRIHLTHRFNSLWQAWKRVSHHRVKAIEVKLSCNALWQIDYIWAAMRYLFRVLTGRQLDSVQSKVSRRAGLALMNWQTFRAPNPKSTRNPRGWNNKTRLQVDFLYLVHLIVYVSPELCGHILLSPSLPF